MDIGHEQMIGAVRSREQLSVRARALRTKPWLWRSAHANARRPVRLPATVLGAVWEFAFCVSAFRGDLSSGWPTHGRIEPLLRLTSRRKLPILALRPRPIILLLAGLDVERSAAPMAKFPARMHLAAVSLIDHRLDLARWALTLFVQLQCRLPIPKCAARASRPQTRTGSWSSEQGRSLIARAYTTAYPR